MTRQQLNCFHAWDIENRRCRLCGISEKDVKMLNGPVHSVYEAIRNAKETGEVVVIDESGNWHCTLPHDPPVFIEGGRLRGTGAALAVINDDGSSIPAQVRICAVCRMFPCVCNWDGCYVPPWVEEVIQQ